MTALAQEKNAITNVFFSHRVRAKVVKAFSTPSFILYGIKKAPDETIGRVEKLLDEIALAVSEQRGRAVKVRFQHPPIMLEVPHPNPNPIPWPERMTNPAHTAIAGRGYEWGRAVDQTVKFDSSPHTLIAGITGSGKSVLAQGLAVSMAMATSPAECRFMIVDLKREDFIPLAKLPHTVEFAGDPAHAMRVIESVAEESARRRDSHGKPRHRLMLWIDELAQLPADGLEMLNSVLALGRSQHINVVSATQHPTAEVMGGSVGKINYTTRLTGRVADATAANTASGRAKTGAEFLPGKGAFIRVEGPDLTRFQAYLIRPNQINGLVRYTRERWATVRPATATSAPKHHIVPTMPTEPHSPPQSTGNVSPEIAAVFEMYHDDDGGLIRGGLMAAKRVLFAGRASSSGRSGIDQSEYVKDQFELWLNASGNTSVDTSAMRPGSVQGDTSSLVEVQINDSPKNGTVQSNGAWL